MSSVLVDFEIDERCRKDKLIDPYDPAMVNPASIDVRIGDTLLKESTGDTWNKIDLGVYTCDHSYLLLPKEFVLVATMETFNMPNDLCGEFRMKSSRAREGYDNALAVWLDPGWHGSKLTLEIVNNRRHAVLPIYPGLKIGQAVFHRCNVPTRSYAVTGRYNNDVAVAGSKG